VTVFAAFMVTVQVVPFAVSQPCQPVKMERKPGLAVSVTTVPLLKSAQHVDPQSIPAGLDVTVVSTGRALSRRLELAAKHVVLFDATPPPAVSCALPRVAA